MKKKLRMDVSLQIKGGIKDRALSVHKCSCEYVCICVYACIYTLCEHMPMCAHISVDIIHTHVHMYM